MKIIISLFAMFIGGLIYIFFRNESLTMFTWFQQMGLSFYVELLRDWAAPIKASLPHAVIYSVPNALWYLSGMLAFSAIWHEQKEKIIWVALLSTIAFGAEIGQHYKIVSGSFNLTDILMMIFALAVFIILENYTNKIRHNEY